MFAVIFKVQPKADRWTTISVLPGSSSPGWRRSTASSTTSGSQASAPRDASCRCRPGATRRPWCAGARHGEHHGAQEKGRFEIFEDYHLRVGEIISDTQPPSGLAVRQTRLDETETGAAKLMTITELTPGRPAGPAEARPAARAARTRQRCRRTGRPRNVREHLQSGKLLLLASWRDADAAASWRPTTPDGAKTVRHRQVRVIRDYGMFERREAPQYYPEAGKADAGAENPRRAAAR